ncbi:hypothetical protein PFICI_04741 [Pestalotiopsis fici W106-1]|uniref:Heterokaryon incompatibility domain-containing protein n=1 Tax=Pestalotiopsis fici (strain W106-1 / CGMCC3.15140) TaxID=1229662 RepID=W3X9Y1_PESFW|nr:uncharacterized protein PFICI_04741 [Pestalotiopsis fici W106-1]ETS82865.1 hypothetical protein PFICI_04741 [Pestalotiopsis fici W106-1]
MEHYTYAPLTEVNEIRVLELCPGSFDDTLRVQLRHSVLGRQGSLSYKALSYTWGSPQDPVAVEIFDTSKYQFVQGHITQNLASALRHLRTESSTRIIWANAICINQNDVAERTSQVAMIGDIYRTATKVVAFLGPASLAESAITKRLESISTMLRVDFGSGNIISINKEKEGWADMEQEVPLTKQDLQSLHRLVQCSWFDRLWIRQEIGLGGPRAFLIYGCQTIPWTAFCTSTFAIQHKPLPKALLPDSELASLRHRLRIIDSVVVLSERKFSLSDLRQDIQYANCVDPKDRIYGVLSQLNQHDAKLSIVPDYSKSTREVYMGVATLVTQHYGHLDIVRQGGLKANDMEDLPTWVPDFTQPMDIGGFDCMPRPLYKLFPDVFSIDGHILRASGLHYGFVQHATPINHESLLSNNRAAVREIKRIALTLKVHDQYPTKETVLEALCATLIAGNFQEKWYPFERQTRCPSVHDARRFLETLIAHTEEPTGYEYTKRTYVQSVQDQCRSRYLFTMNDGHIGIGPITAMPGDEVVSLFGLHTPIVIRRSCDDSGEIYYQIIGVCYVHGFMQGQVLVGRLPPNVWDVYDEDRSLPLNVRGFMERKEGVDMPFTNDPRIEPFLNSLAEKGLLKDPLMEELRKAGPKVLESAGFPLREFAFV